MSIVNQLLTERLRPKNLNQIILLDRVRKALGDNPLAQHLLISGHRGTGKSALSMILAQDQPTLKINGSLARGIDTVRDYIVPFCSTLSFNQSVDDNIKILFIDEFDNATRDFYDSMRATIEQYSDNVRFICTCNYPDRITPEVRDRFLHLNFTPINKDEEIELSEKYKNRILKVSEKFNIEWESDEVLNKFINNSFPSLRKLISLLQNFIDSDIKLITSEHVQRSQFSFIELFEMITKKSDPYKIYQTILGDYSNKADEVLESLGTELPKYIKENIPNKSHLIGFCCIASAEWLVKKNQLIDPILAVNAAIFQINQIFTKD